MGRGPTVDKSYWRRAVRSFVIVGILFLSLILSACKGTPTADVRAAETQIAAKIYATQTASVPILTKTPRATTTPEPTLTPKPTSTANPISTLNPTHTPNPTSTPTATPTLVPAVSAANTVNLRSGPGTGYDLVGAIKQGETCNVLGRIDDSTWLKVRCMGQSVSWVSASVVRMAGDILTVPVEKQIPPPPPTPTPAPVSIPSPTAQSATGTTTAGACPASQATYKFQNFIGAYVDGTFTRQGDAKKASFIMPKNTEQTVCFDPGRWTYTVAAPGWQNINDAFEAVAGQTIQFPINGKCETKPLYGRSSGGTTVILGEVTTCTILKPPR